MPDTPYRRKCRMTPVLSAVEAWAALIKCVYEVDLLKCPKCGGTMKIVGFIEENAVIRKILRHCGLWKRNYAKAAAGKKPGATDYCSSLRSITSFRAKLRVINSSVSFLLVVKPRSRYGSTGSPHVFRFDIYAQNHLYFPVKQAYVRIAIGWKTGER